MAKIYKKRGSSIKSKVALEAIKGKKTTAELCQEYSVTSSQIFTWKKHLEDNLEKIFLDKSELNHKAEIERLHKVIGQLTAERDFLDRVLKR
jgi:transposase